MRDENTFKNMDNMDNINIDNSPFYKRKIFLISAATGVIIIVAIIIIVAASSGDGKDSNGNGNDNKDDSTDDGEGSKENSCIIGKERKCLSCEKNSKKCATCNPGYIVNPNYNRGEECDINYSIKAIYKTEKDNEEIDLLDSNYKNIITEFIVEGENKDISTKYKFPKAGSNIVLFKTNLENISKLSGLFSNNKNIISVQTTQYFNITTIINMDQMFNECTSLENADLPYLSGQKLQTIDKLFNGCSSLKKVGLEYFSAMELTSISEMFKGCISLTSVDLSFFHASKLSSTESMFSDLNSLIHVDLSNFQAENLKSMNKMFYNCQSLSALKLDYLQARSLISMDQMCSNCYSLTSVDIGYSNFQNLESLTKMFENCRSLTEVELFIETTKVKNMDKMFYN